MILRDVYEYTWSAFQETDLLPAIPAYQAAFADLMQRGDDEFVALRDVVGRWRWWRGMHPIALPNLPADNRRVLGMGAGWTDYLIAPLPITDEHRMQVCQLGARANFIVSFYDYLLDHGFASSDILAPDVLLQILRGQSIAPQDTNATGRLLMMIAQDYIAGVTSLPNAKHNTKVQHLLIRAIERMYGAQVALHQGNIHHTYLVRKAAYPFVVMGLAGWLAVPDIEAHGDLLHWHLRWLLRLGWFYGQIDDLVDMHIDYMLHQPNTFLGQNWRTMDDAEAAIQRMIAMAHRVRREWQAHTTHAPSVTMFEIGLAGWLSELPID